MKDDKSAINKADMQTKYILVQLSAQPHVVHDQALNATADDLMFSIM